MIKLTPTEREVLQRLADGESYKEIAATLGLKVTTAASYVGRAKRRMRCRTRHQLIAELVRKEIIE